MKVLPRFMILPSGKPVSIDTQLITYITILLIVGEYPLPLFTDKTKEKSLAEKMKDKYGMHIGACR
jgi:hypothetical protein